METGASAILGQTILDNERIGFDYDDEAVFFLVVSLATVVLNVDCVYLHLPSIFYPLHPLPYFSFLYCFCIVVSLRESCVLILVCVLYCYQAFCDAIFIFL